MLLIKNLQQIDIDLNDLGLTVPASGYYDLSSKDIQDISNSVDIVDHISSGSLVMVKSENPEVLYNKNESIKLVIAAPVDVPKTTSDGEWAFVNENFGHLSGNDVVNWNVEKYLDAGEQFSEKMIIPFGTIFTLNFLEGGSSIVPTGIQIDWYHFDTELNQHIRINPDIRTGQHPGPVVDGNANAGDSVIPMKTSIGESLDIIEINRYYKFADHCYCKVTDVDMVNNTITVDPPLNHAFPTDDAMMCLTDRTIGYKGNQLSNGAIHWTTPPRFQGNAKDYIQITISNDDDMEAGLVTAMVNGWLAPGTI